MAAKVKDSEVIVYANWNYYKGEPCGSTEIYS